jgi:predicted SAM-dependent methyltransferase
LCQPDLLLNLDQEAWPWPDNSVTEVSLHHVLEHLGETTSSYFHVIKELYRVTANGALTKIAVPHPRHESFLADPTHVRAITPAGLAMFDQARNKADLKNGGNESKLGLRLSVNFAVEAVNFIADGEVRQMAEMNKLTPDDLNRLLKFQYNICEEIRIELRTIKI